ATKWCETTQNVSFGPKVVDWMCFGCKTRQYFHRPKLVPKRHPRTRFCNVVLAATKWCKPAQNMSVRPNVVDWMHFGRKSQKKFHWPELVPKRHPRIRFRNGALAATKWCNTTQH